LFGQDKIYDVVEKQPEFPGGTSALLGFISKDLKYPDTLARTNATYGGIYLKLIIEKDGTVNCKAGAESICVEVRKMIAKMPKWKPAEYKGKKVRYCVGRDILSRPKNLGFAIRYC
jgi:protein TonB